MSNPDARRGLQSLVARRSGPSVGLLGAVAYTGLVLWVDVARTQGWLPLECRRLLHELHLTATPSGFDWYKCVAWLLLPLLFTFLTSTRRGYSVSGSRREWGVLGLVFVGSCVAMFIVAASGELAATYLRGSSAYRWSTAQRQLIWTLSWLPGYEFLLRRFLLHRILLCRSPLHSASLRSPVATTCYGVCAALLIAGIEFTYHLQKPLLEAVAVFFFSLGLTEWARRRPTSLLPAAAHLCVEVVLIVFVAVYP